MRGLVKGTKAVCRRLPGIKYLYVKMHHAKMRKQGAAAAHGGPSGFQPASSTQPITEDIKFSILVPLYNTTEQLMQELLDSVVGPRYSNWELCLAEGREDGKCGGLCKH